jgi:hypothetical protein
MVASLEFGEWLCLDVLKKIPHRHFVFSIPKIHAPPVCLLSTGRPAAPSISDDVLQDPAHDDHFYGDPQYSWDDYIES